MEKKIIEEKKLTLAEVKEILKEREEKETELSYVQRITLDYINKFSRFEAEESRQFVNDLVSKFGIDENFAIQIVNLNNPPETDAELDLIFDKSDKKPTDEQKKEILALIKEYKTRSEFL
ncbi:MAG: RNA polymerase Rpb4 family protein [Candidatus Helarchaeota archaeon]